MPRKPKPKAKQKTKVVFVRVTTEQKKQIERKAEKEGFCVATWARSVLLRESREMKR